MPIQTVSRRALGICPRHTNIADPAFRLIKLGAIKPATGKRNPRSRSASCASPTYRCPATKSVGGSEAMRRSTILWSVLCIAVVIGLFVVKHRVQDEDRLQALNAGIPPIEMRPVLEAEWSYLNSRHGWKRGTGSHFRMEPPSTGQTLTLDEFRLQRH